MSYPRNDFNRQYALEKQDTILKTKYNDLLRYLTATRSNELNDQVKIRPFDSTLQFRRESQLNEIFVKDSKMYMLKAE